jgi:hypothetical protein
MNSRWIIACVGAVLWSGALADSETYCEVSSFSFAWGASYGGTAISPKGAVGLFEYDFVKNPRAKGEIGRANWLAPTRRELDKRFKPGRRVVGTLCPDRRAWLRDQLDLVRTAGQSKVVDMQSRDGPTRQSHCFVFKPGDDPGAGAYVFLQDSGDTESHSLSPSAPRLANWLRAVSEEAQRRAKLPAKDDSCIDDPPLADSVYPDPSAEVRQRVLEDLKVTPRLHCQFVKDSSDPPASLSVIFDLDFAARRGHAETFGHSYSVRIDTSIAGLILTNADAEKNRVSDVVTIMPYRTGGRELYPALKQEIHLDDEGPTAIRYTGQCAALPK